MSISLEEVKAFIADAEKAREEWLKLAKNSWDELKKVVPGNNALFKIVPNSVRAKKRYPAWYSIMKIRQPLLLSRAGIPIGRDTTQDGTDNVGATAAICLERLATNLSKTFDFFDVMSACRDDFLATNFAECRAYYERETIKAKVKERIQFMPNEDQTSGVFVDGAGKEIQTDLILEDDEGFFIEHDEIVDIEDEKICLEHILYADIYIDPDIRRWHRRKRLGFAHWYSEREFTAIFGVAAVLTLPRLDDSKADESAPKRQNIKVIEYWDEYENEVKWLADHGTDFIKPKGYTEPEHLEEDPEVARGLYNLRNFFPVPDPLIMNAPTDNFYPVPEYFQVLDVIEDIHTIFARMIALTKAIRARLLFDNNIEGLQEALNEASEGDCFGVTNLSQMLSQNGGTLDGAVQYIPVQNLVESLANLYTALESRLKMLFNLTGTSDLLQGLTTDGSGKTLGERQMEEKYAINQIAEAQRKMQEFVRGAYQLLTEMALKNFKQASLDRYIIPQTLDPDHRQRYQAALGMLKEDFKRFRIELETDSTIAINEQYDKAMRIEMVNTLTAAIEKVAATAESSPALVGIELRTLKFLIQGFRQAKIFQSEITQAIEAVIKEVEAQPEPFNKEQAEMQLNGQKLQLDIGKINAELSLEQQKLQSTERIAMFKLQAEQAIASARLRMDQFIAITKGAEAQGKLQLEYEKLGASVSEAQSKLIIAQNELVIRIQEAAKSQETEEFRLALEAQFRPLEQQLSAYTLQLKEMELQLKQEAQNFSAMNTEIDNMRQETRLELDAAALKHEITKPQDLPPITVNLPAQAAVTKKVKVKRTASGETMHVTESEKPAV